MAIHQTGIAIVIKGFLPMGSSIDEQFQALSIVKAAHESGDYSKLLKVAHDVEVKTENKTRRVEKPYELKLVGDEELANALNADEADQRSELMQAFDPANELADEVAPAAEPGDEAVPEFLKAGKGKK